MFLQSDDAQLGRTRLVDPHNLLRNARVSVSVSVSKFTARHPRQPRRRIRNHLALVPNVAIRINRLVDNRGVWIRVFARTVVPRARLRGLELQRRERIGRRRVAPVQHAGRVGSSRGGDFADAEDPAEGVDGGIVVDPATRFASAPDAVIFNAVLAFLRGSPVCEGFAVEDGG